MVVRYRQSGGVGAGGERGWLSQTDPKSQLTSYPQGSQQEAAAIGHSGPGTQAEGAMGPCQGCTQGGSLVQQGQLPIRLSEGIRETELQQTP